MTEPNLLERAKQGDAGAIADLLNQKLQPQGIAAKATLKHDSLKVVLESSEVPDQKALIAWLETEIIGLGIKSIRTIKVCGKQSGSFDYAWQEEVEPEKQECQLEEEKIESDSRLEEVLDAAYLYLDLEINFEENIYNIGCINNLTEALWEEDLEAAYQQLEDWRQSGVAICGHNFRRFDCTYLFKAKPELHPWLVVDTLELSTLAFPLERSHKLKKDYKQSQYASNNPLEDARETKQLLQEIIAELQEKPKTLRQTFCWLLACGNEEADRAYQQLFEILGWKEKAAPALETLPEEAIAGFDEEYLRQFWFEAPIRDFNSRLCMAALLAGNYESRVTESERIFSGWIAHLPGFQEIWDGAKLLPDYQNCLQKFGIEKFRGKQEQAVRAILRGERPLVIMATGGGKSLCYQLSALMLFERHASLSVVVSPLQALMADQVADLEEQGINFCTFINGNLSVEERSQRLRGLREYSKGLLYISPEQLRSPSIRALLEERSPALWVIDEAHCISQWGHNFRPDYRYIPKYIKELYKNKPLPLLALMTATATVKVQDDIQQLFKTEGAQEIGSVIAESNTRTNLEYNVIPANGNKDQLMIQEVQNSLQQGGCVLVYTTTRRNAEKIAGLLEREGIEARYYHGNLGKTEKDEVLQAFKAGELNAVAATCAFGMGINRKDVRAVIHHAISANLEAYIQETGRAGRDGKPATCTLLFDEKDAEKIFYLQSQMQLTEAELRNIFVSIRNLRDRVHGGASENWFWATISEIYQTSDLDEDFAGDAEYRDIKIKVALQYLENFGLLERAENLSAYVQFELADKTRDESERKFEEYARGKNLPSRQVKIFKKLIAAMHLAKAQHAQRNEPVAFERLSDESGINPKELTVRIQELQKAGVASVNIPLTCLLTKEVKGDARIQYERLRVLEEKLLEALLEIMGDRESIQVNLRNLASRLDPDRSKKIRATGLMDILKGWSSQKWVRLVKLNRDLVRLERIEVLDYLDAHKELSSVVLEVFYEKLSEKTGARLRVEYELGQLLEDVNQKTHPLKASEEELRTVLLWLHHRKILRLTEGANLFHQALKLRVIKGRKETVITSGYQKIKTFYEQQVRRTHLMLKYGQIPDAAARQKLVDDYFRVSDKEFNKAYPELSTKAEAVKRPVLQDDYTRIVGDLNAAQKEIVLAEDPALLVIAGPGSGKTRTIVRRIAHLVKVKRVDPDRILVLAYNRNAVRELRLRLQDIIGSAAARLRVFTFHGLALALLGCTQGENRLSTDAEFQQLLKEACDLIEQGDESDDEDTQARRIQLLGHVEYIFVDEYQDVAEEEYRLIQAIAGLGDSGDESRSVQINLCVIGDDDQNLYEFRGTRPQYIIQFETEYKARRFLLTENYRSTQPIIEAGNNLIRNNRQRCKQTPDEQVRINAARESQSGLPVAAYNFEDISSQSAWIAEKILTWRRQGIPANDIAVLARHWDSLSPIRLLLERQGIATYALKSGDIKLGRHRVTCQIIDELNAQSPIFSAEESVKDWFASRFVQWNRSLEEPTVKTLLEIAKDLDLERGWGSENPVLPTSAGEIVTSLLEFNKSEVFLNEKAVLVTSCHGAKGLEFRKVILLTDGFSTSSDKIESERRLFYVAMTRAKEELILSSTQASQFVRETGVSSQPIKLLGGELPQWMLYLDLSPREVNIGYPATVNQQAIAQNLREGAPLQVTVNRYGDGWVILTPEGQEIGALSRNGVEELRRKGIQPKQFQFQPGEVTVASIYHHLKMEETTGEILEDWFVVIPQIRIFR